MTKRQTTEDAETQSALESTTFFGTSEYTEVPSSAPDLFEPLVEELRRDWDNTFEAAESRLTEKVGAFVRSVVRLQLTIHSVESCSEPAEETNT
jgi:hypothetical protein